MKDVDEDRLIEVFSKGLKEDPLEPIFWLQRELNKILGGNDEF